MKIELENVLPAEIEKRSFEIITEELGDRVFDPLQDRLLSGPFIPVRILNMLIRCAFLSMRWRKRWMRYAKGLIS